MEKRETWGLQVLAEHSSLGSKGSVRCPCLDKGCTLGRIDRSMPCLDEGYKCCVVYGGKEE